jgi:dTDP-4-amino-4,6-dideoxygalactose transaminase
VQTSIHYPPIHRFSAYRGRDDGAAVDLTVTEDISARQVTLPLYPGMSEADVRCVVEAVRESLAVE